MTEFTSMRDTNPGKFLGEVRAVPFAHHMPNYPGFNIGGTTISTAAIRLEQWNGTEWVMICELP